MRPYSWRMSRLRGPLSSVSWFQVIASALAAVTAAWIASNLGVAGTLIGAALGSFVFTLSSAFYSNTLHKGRTLLIQTDRGTVIERHVEEGEVSEAFSEAEDVDGDVVGAQFVEDRPRLHWKTIFATTAIVLVLAMAAITGYELIANHPLGDSGGGTTIGDTFGSGPKDTPATTAPTTPTETPTPSATPTATATPTVVGSPTPTVPTGTATVDPTVPTDTATSPPPTP